MIGIEVNGEFLELGNESIRLEKVNPSFITDLFQGDYSFPFTITDTEKNLRLLGFSNIIEIVNRTVELPCWLYLFNVPYTKAKIIVSAGTSRTIKINIVAGIRAMTIAEKSLKEINYGDDYTLGVNQDTIFANIKEISLNTNYQTFPFTFVPHKNEEFYGSANPDFCGVINRQNSVTGDFYRNNGVTGAKYTIVPFLYLFFILKKIFEAEGLTPIGNFWNDTEMQKLLMYNNFALDSDIEYFDDNCYVYTGPQFDYLLIEKVRFLKGLSGTNDPSNAWNNSFYEYTIQQAGDITIDVIINATVADYAEGPFSYSSPITTHPFGFDVFIDNTLISSDGDLSWPELHLNYDTKTASYSYSATVDDVGKKIYLKSRRELTNRHLLLHSGSSLAIYNTSEPYNLVSKTISFKNHVKDISVSEFLTIFKNTGVSINFDYEKRFVSLDFDKDSIISNKANDFTSKVTAEYEINFEDYKKGYKINYDFGSADTLVQDNFKLFDKSKYIGSVISAINAPIPIAAGLIISVLNSNKLYISKQYDGGIGYYWEVFCDNYYDIVLGKGEKQSKCKIAPMFMDFANNEGGTSAQNFCLVPASKQSGSSTMFGLGENDFDLRFVFLRGVNQSNSLVAPQGGNYIYAGTSLYGLNGNEVGNYEFTLNSPNGIIDKFILTFLKALTVSDIIERDALLNELDVLSLIVKDKWHIDGVYYLLKSISIPVGTKLGICRAKLLKL